MKNGLLNTNNITFFDFEEIIYFLKRTCKADVGFYGQVPRKDKPVAPTTATILLALNSASCLTEEEKEKWLDELLQFQCLDHSFCKVEGSSVWATSWAVWCYFTLNKKPELNVDMQKSVEWLLEAQKNGGWGFNKESSPRPFYTYYAAHAVKVAYKKLKWKKLGQSLKSAIKYINKSQIKGRIGEWARDSTSSEISLADTAMALLLLIENKKQYPNLVDNEVINTGMAKLIDLLKDRKNWYMEWTETTTPLFYICFFTPALLILLLRYGIPPYDLRCINFVNWFKENLRKHGDKGIGWCGNIRDEKGRPYSWATALGLISLNCWLKKLQESNKIEVVNYISKLALTPLIKEKFERLHSAELLQKISKLSNENKRLKRKTTFFSVMSVFLFIFFVSYITKIPSFVISSLLGLPQTTWNDIVIGVATSLISSLIIYLLSLVRKLRLKRKDVLTS